MITGKGIGFVIVAVLVFLLARLTQVGWLYLMDAVLWGIVLLSAVLPWLGVAFLEARRRVEHEERAKVLAARQRESQSRLSCLCGTGLSGPGFSSAHLTNAPWLTRRIGGPDFSSGSWPGRASSPCHHRWRPISGGCTIWAG
jgi:hypothetical protein